MCQYPSTWEMEAERPIIQDRLGYITHTHTTYACAIIEASIQKPWDTLKAGNEPQWGWLGEKSLARSGGRCWMPGFQQTDKGRAAQTVPRRKPERVPYGQQSQAIRLGSPLCPPPQPAAQDTEKGFLSEKYADISLSSPATGWTGLAGKLGVELQEPHGRQTELNHAERKKGQEAD